MRWSRSLYAALLHARAPSCSFMADPYTSSGVVGYCRRMATSQIRAPAQQPQGTLKHYHDIMLRLIYQKRYGR